MSVESNRVRTKGQRETPDIHDGGDGRGNERALVTVMERLLFVSIVKFFGTVDIAEDIDVDWSMLVRIPCNGAVKRVPGGVVPTDGSSIEGV